MMLFKTYLSKSPLHGIGIFAGEDIALGSKVWEFTEEIDLCISVDKISTLPLLQQEILFFYGYREVKTKDLILCADNARHFNFTKYPNTGSPTDSDDFSSFALRDIAKGEELTFSVLEDDDAEQKLGKDLYHELLPVV